MQKPVVSVTSINGNCLAVYAPSHKIYASRSLPFVVADLIAFVAQAVLLIDTLVRTSVGPVSEIDYLQQPTTVYPRSFWSSISYGLEDHSPCSTVHLGCQVGNVLGGVDVEWTLYKFVTTRLLELPTRSCTRYSPINRSHPPTQQPVQLTHSLTYSHIHSPTIEPTHLPAQTPTNPLTHPSTHHSLSTHSLTRYLCISVLHLLPICLMDAKPCTYVARPILVLLYSFFLVEIFRNLQQF